MQVRGHHQFRCSSGDTILNSSRLQQRYRIQRIAHRRLGDFQVVVALHVDPAFGAAAKHTREAQCYRGGDGLFFQDVTQGLPRDAEHACDFHLGPRDGGEDILAEHFAGMDGAEAPDERIGHQ